MTYATEIPPAEISRTARQRRLFRRFDQLFLKPKVPYLYCKHTYQEIASIVSKNWSKVPFMRTPGDRIKAPRGGFFALFCKYA